MMPYEADTIVAVSTPPGRGGIGIVRLSGPLALGVAARLLALKAPLEHARARFTYVVDPSDAARTLDEAVVTAFLVPHSYTGEDLVEIATHGSPVILEAVVQAALAASVGAETARVRLATAGEFTQRAFLSGRLDLTQAEAVHDLIAAQTLDQARVAAQQMGGALSHRVTPAKDALLHLVALLEAGMDFASGELDDVEVVPPAQIAAAIAETRAPLAELAASFRQGQLVRNGLALALVGLPNAGKSSLFNRLLARERAIVTASPGTTRDTLEETIALNGIPLRVIDTAGIREAVASAAKLDEAETLGIARSREALADADLVVFLHDATQAMTAEERALLESLGARPHLRVQTKVDLVEVGAAEALQEAWIDTSAVTNFGLDELRAAILRAVHAEGALAASGALNNLRQHEAVREALAALDRAEAANVDGLPHELILIELHAALGALDSLTGMTTAEDILARIFSTFCIGK
jgi:tRNA modification GTPase